MKKRLPILFFALLPAAQAIATGNFSVHRRYHLTEYDFAGRVCRQWLPVTDRGYMSVSDVTAAADSIKILFGPILEKHNNSFGHKLSKIFPTISNLFNLDKTIEIRNNKNREF